MGGGDPLAGKYPNVNPNMYCLESPVKYIDPDGRNVSFPTISQANAIVSELNAIYKDKYNDDGALSRLPLVANEGQTELMQS